MGGMVLETNMTEILTRIEEQNKLEKSEVIISPYYFLLLSSLFPSPVLLISFSFGGIFGRDRFKTIVLIIYTELFSQNR